MTKAKDEKQKQKQIIETIVESTKNKVRPLFGNSRSFSNRANSKIFGQNKQKLRIAGKTYRLPVRFIR